MASTVEQIKQRRVKVEYGIEDETGVSPKPMQAQDHKPLQGAEPKTNSDTIKAAASRDQERINELQKYMSPEKAQDYVKRNPSR